VRDLASSVFLRAIARRAANEDGDAGAFGRAIPAIGTQARARLVSRNIRL
jgi:hypothetical protein